MLKDIFSMIMGWLGLVLLSYGAWLLTPALGFACLGAALMAYSFLLARSNAYVKTKVDKG